MEEDEDDVFRKDVQRWPSSPAPIKQTETNGMLRCRPHAEPQRLLYGAGNAGLLLLAPSNRSPPPGVILRQDAPAMDRPAQSIETLIGQKLQRIGDQFYQEHMMRPMHPRDRAPLWWRVALAVCSLLFGRRRR